MSATALLSLSEIRETARNRWLLVACAGFAVLSAALTVAGSAGGSAGFGPTAAGLIDIELIAVPLFALVLGAMSIARDRERGTYSYFRALPITLREMYVSKLAGVACSITAVVFGGFAGAFVAMAILGEGGADVLAAMQFLLVTWLLGLACGAIGIAVSACARRSPSALGAAVALWLLLVIFGDLGIMATSVITRMNVTALFALTALNPIEAYKIAALCALSGSVDVLGPGGRLATDMLGPFIMPAMVSVLLLWTACACVCGWVVLRRRSDA